jgi:hypothetical protein
MAERTVFNGRRTVQQPLTKHRRAISMPRASCCGAKHSIPRAKSLQLSGSNGYSAAWFAARHSLRPYDGLPELIYPFHDREVLVIACGRLCLHRNRINISLCWLARNSGSRSRRRHLARQLHAL